MTLQIIAILLLLTSIVITFFGRRRTAERELTQRDLVWLGWKPTHRHYKGGFYEEATRAIACDDVVEGEAVVVYVGSDGRTYVRSARQFDEPSRFWEL